MKQRKIQAYGDVAKLREMLTTLDRMLEWTGDPAQFTTVHPDTIQAIAIGLLDARTSVSNSLSLLGDDRGFQIMPTEQCYRDKYKFYEEQNK